MGYSKGTNHWYYCRKLEVNVSISLLILCRCHVGNVPATGPKEYWKRALFIPCIDHLLKELRDRLIKHEDMFVAHYLIPSKLESCSLQVVNSLFNTFADDFPFYHDSFYIEVEMWDAQRAKANGQNPGTLVESLHLINFD